ncbi:MAG: type I CRISPR-associated protein Cas7 [Pirellulaceae bacterium]|nr:type I CRISPR-associated protein Cas7 [Pirellulaceae bacterium]
MPFSKVVAESGRTLTKSFWLGRSKTNTGTVEFSGTHFSKRVSGTPLRRGRCSSDWECPSAPIDISRHTNTSKSGVQVAKDRGMAPMGYRFVPHGVYVMPFFVNPSAARKSGCTKPDIDLMLAVIPFAHPHTRSHARPIAEVRHAWYIEHKNVLGSCSDFTLIAALTPKKKSDPESASKSWDDYDVPTELSTDLKTKVVLIRDLMAENVSASSEV